MSIEVDKTNIPARPSFSSSPTYQERAKIMWYPAYTGSCWEAGLEEMMRHTTRPHQFFIL